MIKHTQEIKYKAVKEWITPNVFLKDSWNPKNENIAYEMGLIEY